MKTSQIIESIGVLLKEEVVQTVEHYVIENSLVLESIEPFPGYHGENLPTDTKPDLLLFITDKQYPVESIFRVSQHLCCRNNIPLDASPVEVTVNNTTYNGIRVRGLGNYSLIPEIQGCFLQKDFHFMKMKLIRSAALMRIIKIFRIKSIDEQVFMDMEDDSTFYLEIPYHFGWDRFRDVTRMIKNNMDNSNFDCASGFIYQKELIEFVRIYDKKADLHRLKSIRDKYINEISRIRDDAL